MCGKEGNLVKALIEGVEMEVCNECSKLGRVIGKSNSSIVWKERDSSGERRVKEKEPNVIQSIVENYSELVKRKREKLGLKQEELAMKIAEKESVVHNIESGHLEPSIKVAEKLERFLKIKLIEFVNEESFEKKKDIMERELTLGDLIEIKRKEK